MSNLFLDALDQDVITEIEKIKKNKRFALSLHRNLDEVFRTNYEVRDSTHSVDIQMKTSERSNYYGAFGFQATKSGVVFYMQNFLSFKGNKSRPLVEKLLEHPKTKVVSGTNQFDLFLDINEDDSDLKEKLNIIFKFMEYSKYQKRF